MPLLNLRLEAARCLRCVVSLLAVGQPLLFASPVVVPIRLLDSATGCAVQPESIAIRPERPGGVEQRMSAMEAGTFGQGAFWLEPGPYILEVTAPNYRPLSARFEVPENNPYRFQFHLDPVVLPRELQPDDLAAMHREAATLVQGFVVEDESGLPLQEVRVTSTPSGVEARTDGRGFFQFYVPVQTEDEAAAAPAELKFEQPGYEAVVYQYVELWSDGDWTYRVRLSRGEGRKTIDERQVRRRVADRPAAATAPSKALAGPAALAVGPVEPPDTPGVLATSPTNSTVRVPRNIRVLRSDGTTIDYVTLDYYCKHVLPAEWIASWASYTGGSNSLNAGAVALRTYAIGYINNPRAASYDICGTTACQAYRPELSSSYSDTAVNFTANYVAINASGAIPSGLTEYSAENNSLANSCGDGFTEPSTTGPVCIYDPVCSGEARYGHGRGMCQWGSAKWATGLKFPGNRTTDHTTPNGYPRRDWVWICRHYYPNLTLVKGAALLVGDDVRALTTVNTRACPGGTITNGTGCSVVASRPAGSRGTIIAGPTRVTADGGGYTWYRVQWSDGIVGWSVENYLERVFELPPAPTGLVASASGTSRIDLSWRGASGIEAGFFVERSPAAGGPWLEVGSVAAGVTNYSDQNLYAGSTWYYRVRAYNAGGTSAYSGVSSATTVVFGALTLNVPGDQAVTAGTYVVLTNTATASDFIQLLTDFEPFLTETANGIVLFREPANSPTTAAFLAATPDLAAITDVFPAGVSGTRVLRVNCSFNPGSNPWLRLSTAGAAFFPNPVIDFRGKLRFSLFCDRAVRVAAGCREAGIAAGTAIGANGGVTGAIEWVGVTNVAGTAPMPTRLIPAKTWTSLTFDLPNEPVRSFSGGDGVLATGSGLGVLDHLAIVPASGSGVYNLYLDNFVVLIPRALQFGLEPGAPAGAAIAGDTGVFTWPTSDAWANTTNTIGVRVTDNSVPPLSRAQTFQIAVLSRPALQVQTAPGGAVMLTWSALPGSIYRVQFKNRLEETSWTDLSPEVTPDGPIATFAAVPGAAQRFYRVMLVRD